MVLAQRLGAAEADMAGMVVTTERLPTPAGPSELALAFDRIPTLLGIMVRDDTAQTGPSS